MDESGFLSKIYNFLLHFTSLWFFELGYAALTKIRFKKGERIFKVENETCLVTLESHFHLIC